jgi:hypothetical protein
MGCGGLARSAACEECVGSMRAGGKTRPGVAACGAKALRDSEVEGALVSEDCDVVRCAPKKPGGGRLTTPPKKGSKTKTIATGSACAREPKRSCE